MSEYTILAWQPLLRPPPPCEEPPRAPQMRIPLKALVCWNHITSLAALVTSSEPIEAAKLVISDLVSNTRRKPAEAASVRVVGALPTPEAGLVCDPLIETDEFAIDKSAALLVTIRIPRETPAGVYRGSVSLLVDGRDAARSDVEIEVANVVLPDPRDWRFFLNVWMNPAPVARHHGVKVWSDEHFDALRPYITDLAEHGQKTAVVPICYQPWGTQTRDPYPSAVLWKRRAGNYEFDFSVFDRYVELHAECGIDRAIHCYSIAQAGKTDQSVIEYVDADSGETKQIVTRVGDREYVRAWSAFFDVFRAHLDARGWLDRVYIGFDEKTDDVMAELLAFMQDRAPDFKVALAGNTSPDFYNKLGDVSLTPGFNDRGIAERVPAKRSSMGMAALLSADNAAVATEKSVDKMTTFYVCCGPEHPNTFLHSPLVESRMLPYLAAQGGYDGFLRWSYNDWTDDPYKHPEWGHWPTGDTFFVYPGDNGPVSSLRWEQLREGIQDYELALIASANIRTSEEMVDYEQAISLACRYVDGRAKSIGDIEIARRLLIPLAEHQREGGE